MNTIAQIVSEVVARPAPVVFLDTCAILDVARAPARSQPDSVAAAIRLTSLASNIPTEIHLLIVDIVGSEWSAGIDSAMAEMARSIGIHDNVVHVASMVGEIDPPRIPDLLPRLAEKVRVTSESLLKACRVIERDPDAMSAAIGRVVQKQRPSHKYQVKDSYILEHCLAVARGIRSAACGTTIMFVSSNSDDFATKATRSIHKELERDFDSVGMQYEMTLGSALATLHTSGQIP